MQSIIEKKTFTVVEKRAKHLSFPSIIPFPDMDDLG